MDGFSKVVTMPIVQWGKTACGVCGKPVFQDDASVSTPAFLQQTHPFWRYSDALFHQICFENSPDRAELERLLSRYKELRSQAPDTLEAYEAWARQAMREFE